MYMHHTSELLSNFYPTLDMSRVSAEGLSYYTVLYGLNYRWLKDSAVVHQSVQWKTMEDCFRDIHNIGVGYKRPNNSCRAAFNTPEASMVTEVETLKEPDLCYKCAGPQF